MQGLTLLLLLGIVASTMFGFAPVFAQEAPSEDEMPDEEIMDEEVMDDTMDDTMEETDETMDDAMEEEMLTTMALIASPLQLKSGTDPHEIQCGEGMKLVFKASNFRPSCIKESSYDVLSQRGWVSAHEPSHEELAGMMESMPKDEVMEENPGEIELEEKVEVEESASSGNGTEPTPQNHTIELSESMEMGAN